MATISVAIHICFILNTGQGVRGLRDGDVDLMGLERPPLKEQLTIFEENMRFADKVLATHHIDNRDIQLLKIQETVVKVSKVIDKLQRSITAKCREQNDLRKSNAGNKKSERKCEYSISLLNVRKHDCEINLKKAVNLNFKLLRLAARCQSLEPCFSDSDFFTLSNSPLACVLIPVEILQDYLHLDMSARPIEVKQGSELWFKLRRIARVTGSSMYEALGLDTFDLQKKHFAHFVKGVPRTFDDKAKTMMEYGRCNEVHLQK